MTRYHTLMKEIPGHSKREDTESIYSELCKCKLSKSRMVLPLKSLDGKYLATINDKDVMLYCFVEHRVLSEIDIEISRILEVLEDLFDGLSKIKIPKHPFKTYSNWFERGASQLRKKVSDHKLSESNLVMIYKFSKKYIPNIAIRDVKYLVTRPKLGNLFDPKSCYSDEQLKNRMDDFYYFCLGE